jgi:hypothetical protein
MVVEQGMHHELMERRGGVYRRLVDAQAREANQTTILGWPSAAALAEPEEVQVGAGA